MQSDSEEFEANPIQSSFFEGLSVAPRLTQK
jgi:hypothetical protein